MRGIWTVGRLTFSQCLRTKVAGVFIVLLITMLAVMPFVMKGDGTLAGRIRTFLAYGTGLTSLLLTLVTVFLSAGLIASDVRLKQIFTVATKPVYRWQYVTGRWLGVVMLNLVLLTLSAGAIFGLAQYLRTREAVSSEDRREIETEIFAARARVFPQPMDIEPEVTRRIDSLKSENRYQGAVEAYKSETNGDETKARVKLEEEIRKQVIEAAQSAAPGRGLAWMFNGIRVSKISRTDPCKVIERDPDNQLLLFQATPEMIGNLTYSGPVKVEGIDGKVVSLGRKAFVVSFTPEMFARPKIAELAKEQTATVTAEPTIQISYQPDPARAVPDNTLQSVWVVENPTTPVVFQEARNDSAVVPSTLTVPASLVDDNGRTHVAYINGSPISVTIRQDNIAVMYRVGSFEWNFFRGMFLILFQMMFLSAVGTLAGAFLSFPVACLVSFAVLPFGMMQEFLTDAMRPNPLGLDTAFDYLGRGLFAVMKLLLPNLSSLSPTDSLVDGIHIAWSYVGEQALVVLCLRVLLVLAAACLIFHRREIAGVQV